MNPFVAQHLAALRNALRRLVVSPLNTLLSLLVIGIALALPSAGWVVLDNLRGITGSASGVQQISVFMSVDASKKEVGEIESRLREAKPGSWRFVARDEALKRLQSSEGMAEIEVAKLIGATDAFIRRPFHYFGALQGALGGILAALLVGLGSRLLEAPVGELVALYGGSFVLHSLPPAGVAALAGIGAALGWLGAQLSVAIHLRRIG